MAPDPGSGGPARGSRAIRIGAAFSFFAPLLVYLVTLCPWLFWRDVPEFSMVPFLLDISHPPGSPTYALIGKLAALVPLGSVSLRANLLSAVVGAAASLLVYLACLEAVRAIRPRREGEAWYDPLSASASAGIAALVAFASADWYWATVAEVYTMLIAACAGCLLLAARLLRSTPGDGGTPPAVWASLLALFAGLAAGVHPNGLLFLPAACLFLFVASFGRLRAGGLAIWPLFLVLGASVYLYLPIRSSTPLVYDYGNPENLSGIVDHLTARSYAARVYAYPWARAFAHWARVPWMIAGQVGFATLVAGALGMVVAFARRPLLAGLAAWVVCANLWLVKDWTAPFGYLPVFCIWAILAGVGAVHVAAFVLSRLDGSGVSLAGRGLNLVLALAVALTASVQLGRWWPEADKSGHTLAARHGKAALDSLPEEAVLISSADHLSYAIHYLQHVEHYRTDVAHIHRAYLPYGHALATRWPELGWSEDVLAGRTPAIAFLMDASTRRPLFVDRTWYRTPLVPVERLAPHGIVYRVLPDAADRLTPEMLADHQRVMARYFDPILADPWFTPADWTAQQVYASVQNGLGEYFYSRGERPLAEHALRRARDLCPSCPFAYHNLASVHMAAGEMDQARADLDAGLAETPEDPMLLADAGRWLEAAGRGSEAIPFYEHAVLFQPELEAERLSLATLLVRAGRVEEALRHLAVLWASAADPGRRLRAGLVLATARAEQGDAADAQSIAAGLLEMEPDNPDVRALAVRLGLMDAPESGQGEGETTR